MDTPYDVEEWAAGTTLGRHVFNYRYRQSGRGLKGWKLLKTVTLQEDPEVTQHAYLWQSTSDPEHEMVRVDVTERDHWRLAQKSLLDHLTASMRPDIPRGTRNAARIGDVVFVGREARTDVAAAVLFTRGNVCVSVASAGEKNVDVSEIALRVDLMLSEPPVKRELESGKARAQTPRAVTVKPNQAYVLIKDVRRAAPKGKWLKVIAPDGEVSKRDGALIYVSEQGGRKQVRTFAVSVD